MYLHTDLCVAKVRGNLNQKKKRHNFHYWTHNLSSDAVAGVDMDEKPPEKEEIHEWLDAEQFPEHLKKYKTTICKGEVLRLTIADTGGSGTRYGRSMTRAFG